MPDGLDDLIRRTRRVLREGDSEDRGGLPAAPRGFADRVDRVRSEAVRPSTSLLLWHRLSFAGLAIACAVAVSFALSAREQVEAGELAADPWLDMPMSTNGSYPD